MNSSVVSKPSSRNRSRPNPYHFATAASKASISSGVAGRSSRLLRMATDGYSPLFAPTSGPPKLSSMCSVVFMVQVSLRPPASATGNAERTYSIPSFFQIASTFVFTPLSIVSIGGHSRVNPSAAHFLVASIPILLPKFGSREA